MSSKSAASHSATQATVNELVALRLEAQRARLNSRQRSHALLAGSYRSGFRGRGMDFSEVREYLAGDDIRSIDWRVTARTGRTHTKLFNEERERPVIFVIDQRAGMQFGTRVAFKSVIAARASALLAWTACAHGDRIGALLFDDSQHRELRPGGGKRGVLKLINALARPNVPADEARQDLAAVALRLRRVARPGSLVFVFSDFHGWNPQVASALGQLAQHCELVTGFIYDPLEMSPPPPGHYLVSDGQRISRLDTHQRTQVEAIRQRFQRHRQTLEHFCRQHGQHFLAIATNDDLAATLEQQLAALSG